MDLDHLWEFFLGFTAFIDKPDYFLKFKFAVQLIDS